MADDKTLPAPLTPADCDLRGLQFMPLDVIRLRDSSLAAVANGEEFRAAVLLWCASWTQVPAASLPDDEREICALAGLGRDLKGWRKIAKAALRGWKKCSDGRLYHTVVAEKALEAWERRQDHEETVDQKTERQRRWRERVKELSAKLREMGITPPRGASLQTLEQMVVDAVETPHVDAVDVYSRRCRDGVEIGKTGTGTGTGTVSPKPPSLELANELFEVVGIDPMKQVSPNWHRLQSDLCGAWLKIRPREEILDAVRQTVATMRVKEPGWTCATLKFFDGWVRNPRPMKPLSEAEQAMAKAREIVRARGIAEKLIDDHHARRWVLVLDGVMGMAEPTLRHWGLVPPWETSSTCPKPIAAAFPDAIERLKAAAEAGVVIA